MKKLIILVLLCTKFGLNAQTYTYKGNSSFGLLSNYTDLNGIAFGLDYCKYIKSNLYLKGYTAYEMSNFLNMKHSSYMANVNMMYILPIEANKFITSIGGGLMGSYDNLDQNKELGQSFLRNGVSLGIISSIEEQIFLSKQVAIVSNVNFNYNLKTDFATFKWWLGLGLRYNF